MKRYEDYTDSDISSRDQNIGIRYTNEDIVGDTILLLRYNCPDQSCDFAGLGWPDLHRHVRNTHHKKMCDICTRNKKVFTHEHELFTDKELEKHKDDPEPYVAHSWHARGHDYGANFTVNFCAPVVETLENVEGVDRSLWANVSAYYEKDGRTYSIG